MSNKDVLREVDVPGDITRAVAAVNRCDLANAVVHIQEHVHRGVVVYTKLVLRVRMGSPSDLRCNELRSPA